MEKPQKNRYRASNWLGLKKQAEAVKDYLKGRFIEKGNWYVERRPIATERTYTPDFYKKRKKKKKAAYRSRRINRKRAQGVN